MLTRTCPTLPSSSAICIFLKIILSISRGWELDAQDGSCEITLMKPIAEDEHVMVTLRADTQEDMNYDEEVCISS